MNQILGDALDERGRFLRDEAERRNAKHAREQEDAFKCFEQLAQQLKPHLERHIASRVRQGENHFVIYFCPKERVERDLLDALPSGLVLFVMWLLGMRLPSTKAPLFYVATTTLWCRMEKTKDVFHVPVEHCHLLVTLGNCRSPFLSMLESLDERIRVIGCDGHCLDFADALLLAWE